jgi:hypothetical protein
MIYPLCFTALMYPLDKSKIKKRNIFKRVSAIALSCAIVVALFSIFSLALPEGLSDYVSIYDSVSEIPARTKTLTSSFEFACGAVDDYTVRSGSEYGYAMIAVSLATRSAYPSGVNNVDAFTAMLNDVFTSGSYYYVFFDYNFTNYINSNARRYMVSLNTRPVVLEYFPLLPIEDKSLLTSYNYYVYDSSGNFINTGQAKLGNWQDKSNYYGMFVMPTHSGNNNYYLTVQNLGKLVPVYYVWLNQPYFGKKYVLIKTNTVMGGTVWTTSSYVYTPAVSGKITSYYYYGAATTTYPDAEAVWQIGVDRFIDTFKLNYVPPPPPTDFASEIIRVSPILGTVVISLFEVPLLGWLLMVLGCFSLIGFVIYLVKNSLGSNGGDV